MIKNLIAENINRSHLKKDFVQSIGDRKYVFSRWNKVAYDVTDYENDVEQITHACLERHINDKVDVIGFMRDFREDWGDDGGFCFYVGKYNDRLILGSNYISYNNEFSKAFINEPTLEAQDENEEYMYFDSIEEINAFIDRMFKETDKLTKEDDEWGYESWDLEAEDFESPFMHLCIRNLGSSFCEDPERNELMIRNLTSGAEYKPQTDDPMEFLTSWAERTGADHYQL